MIEAQARVSFLNRGALCAGFYRSGPPADAGGTDTRPGVATARGTDSDFAAHVEQLKKKLPSEDSRSWCRSVCGDRGPAADAVKSIQCAR